MERESISTDRIKLAFSCSSPHKHVIVPGYTISTEIFSLAFLRIECLFIAGPHGTTYGRMNSELYIEKKAHRPLLPIAEYN
jgi:hypothetical protein